MAGGGPSLHFLLVSFTELNGWQDEKAVKDEWSNGGKAGGDPGLFRSLS